MTYRWNKTCTALLLVSLCLSSCGGSPEEKEARYLKRGESFLSQGDFKKARLEFLNAVQVKPTDANATYHLALVDDAEGKFRDAFTLLTNAEQQDAHFHPALLKLAEYYMAGGLYDQADQRLQAVLAEDPADAQAHALHAARFLRQKQVKEAEAEARQALATAPNHVLAFAVLAGIYKAQNNLPQALATLQAGLDLNPKEQILLRAQAQLYEQTGDLAKAAQVYQTLFAVAPTEKKFRLQLAQDYIKAGQLDQAEAVLRAGVVALPDDWDMKHDLVLFLDAHRSMADVEKEINRFLATKPDRSEPLDWLTDIYFSHHMEAESTAFLDPILAQNNFDRLWLGAMTAKARLDFLNGDKEKALQRLTLVLEKDPNNLNAAFIKARIEAEQGLYQQAIIDLRSLLRDRPHAHEVYTLLSEVLLHQGHVDLAIDTLNQWADITPLTVPEQVRLAQLYAMNGNARHALDMLFITAKTDPDYPITRETVARLALGLKDMATAEAAIDILDGMPGQHLVALFLRGTKLDLTGNSAEAIAAFSQVIHADPTTPLAEKALTALVQAYKTQGQLAEAVPYLESLKPTPVISTLLGTCYITLGDQAKATQAFDKAIADGAVRQDPYIGRAGLFIRQKNTDAAIALLARAARVDVADMRAPLAQAQLLERRGDYQSAIFLYSHLLTQHPDSDLIANNLAEAIADHAYTDPQQLEQAHQIAARFTASPNPVLLDTLGWVYFRQGRHEEALAIMERAASLTKQLSPQFHYHYGATLLRTGRRDQAAAELHLATVPNATYAGRDDAEKMEKELSVAP